MAESIRPEDDREVLATLLGKAIKEKDDEALVALVSLLGTTRYFRQLKAYLSTVPGAHTGTREDAIQETFIRFMERVRSGEVSEVPPDVLKYVARLATFYLRDRLRYSLHEDSRESASLTSIKHTAVDTRFPGPVTELDLRDHRKILEEAMAELPAQERDILLLCQDLTYDEVAERLGRGKDMVRLIAKRAEMRLLQKMVRKSPALEEKYLEVTERNSAARGTPTADEIREAVELLPPELRRAVAAVHYQQGSFDQLVSTLGREKAEARRDAGYEMLSMQFGGLPFPDTFGSAKR